jgi:hypothetical protein
LECLGLGYIGVHVFHPEGKGRKREFYRVFVGLGFNSIHTLPLL